MKKQDKLFSVDDEVALHPEQNREQTHAEALPEAPEKGSSSGECYYSSAAFEPGVGNGDSPEYRKLIRMEQERYPASVARFFRSWRASREFFSLSRPYFWIRTVPHWDSVS